MLFIRHSLEVLLTGADVGLVAVHSHVYQFGQVSHSVCGQTESGVLDGGNVSVPQDARVCSNQKPTHVNWERQSECCCGAELIGFHTESTVGANRWI